MSSCRLSCIKEELSGLFSGLSSSFAEASRIRSSSDRVDAYVSVLRGALSSSSLCYIGGELMCWDGRAYVRLSLRDLQIAVSNLLPSVGLGATDIRKIGDMPYSVIYERSMDEDTGAVSFTDCMYEISSGTRLGHDASRSVTYELGYPLGDGGCSEWERFLSEVLPDADERACLQEFFGMCFVDRGRLSVEKMAMLIGSGSNGKSVVFDVMKGVLGADRVSYMSPDQLINEKSLVNVRGKVLNFSPDIRRGASFDSGLKALASSQDVQGWELYKGAVVVRCPPIVFAFNELPRFRDVTDAFFRRVLPFGFDVVIPHDRQDRGLAARIVAKEAGGVFLWMMEGRKRLVANGGAFTPCRKIDGMIAEMKGLVRSVECPVRDWLDSSCWSERAADKGQKPERVYVSDVFDALGGEVPKDAITREMTSMGVRSGRGDERYFYLYRSKEK